MATSGSTDYTMTARQLVTFALRKCRIVATFASPSAEEMASGIEDLNLMLKGWQMSGPNLWRQTEGSVTLVADTASYALSPRPYRVIDARYRDTAGRDLPMEMLTRQEYYDMLLKTTQGIPTQWYFDPQRDAGTLYVWPVLSAATTETIRFTYQRRFEDIDSPDDNIDIAQEYLDVVGYALADRLCDTFGVDDPKIGKRAAYLMAQAASADREDVYRFVPDLR